MSPLEHKVLIDELLEDEVLVAIPLKGEAAALESEMALRAITTDTQLAIIAAGMGGYRVLVQQDILPDSQRNKEP